LEASGLSSVLQARHAVESRIWVQRVKLPAKPLEPHLFPGCAEDLAAVNVEYVLSTW
jgi:hypothetical protein